MDGPKMIAGAIAGIVLTSFGLIWLIPDQSPAVGASGESAASVLDPTTPTTLPWIAAGEVQFESTVLIPIDIFTDDGAVVLDYDLTTLAPSGGIQVSVDGGPLVDALPERWALNTVSGGATVDTTDPSASSVRFDVRPGLQTEHIADIRLIGWRVAVPTQERVTLNLTTGESADFAGGTGVTVATILDQSNSTIVQTDVDLPHDRWSRIEIDAVDPGWRKSGRLEGGLQFIWDGTDAPSVLVLEQSSPTWVPVEGDLVVFRGGDR